MNNNKNSINNDLQALKSKLNKLLKSVQDDIETLSNNFDMLDAEIIQETIYFNGMVNSYCNLYFYCNNLDFNTLDFIYNSLQDIKIDLKRLLSHIDGSED